MVYDAAHRDRTTDLGGVRINNDAITAIAAVAAMEIRGVYKMGGGIGKTLYEIFTKRVSSKGVRIDMKSGEMKLAVFVVVEYGVEIPRIADEVQNNVKRAVEKMTGLVLSEVDVVVEGVHAQGQKICTQTK